jgi:hypothetical protein
LAHAKIKRHPWLSAVDGINEQAAGLAPKLCGGVLELAIPKIPVSRVHRLGFDQ